MLKINKSFPSDIKPKTQWKFSTQEDNCQNASFDGRFILFWFQKRILAKVAKFVFYKWFLEKQTIFEQCIKKLASRLKLQIAH